MCSSDLDDFHRLGVATGRPRVRSPVAGPEGSEVGSLEQDQTDSQGTRWRCFTTGDPPQKNRVNMSVLEPYLRVLSHGGQHWVLVPYRFTAGLGLAYTVGPGGGMSVCVCVFLCLSVKLCIVGCVLCLG